jgi:hypothetical protein
VGDPGLDDVALSRPQYVLPAICLHRHLPFEHFEALFFGEVQVGRGQDHVGRDPHLEREQLAARLRARLQKLDALLA